MNSNNNKQSNDTTEPSKEVSQPSQDFSATDFTQNRVDSNEVSSDQKGVKSTATKNTAYLIPQIEGLTYEKVPGDGHCFYHAVGLYCGKSQDLLRNEVALYLA